MNRTIDVSATTTVESTTGAISIFGHAATKVVPGSHPGPSLGQHPGQPRKRCLSACHHGKSVIFIVSLLLYHTAWPRFYPTPPAYYIINTHRQYSFAPCTASIPLPRAPPVFLCPVHRQYSFAPCTACLPLPLRLISPLSPPDTLAIHPPGSSAPPGINSKSSPNQLRVAAQ